MLNYYICFEHRNFITNYFPKKATFHSFERLEETALYEFEKDTI